MILDHLGAFENGEVWANAPGQHESKRMIYDVSIGLGTDGPAFELQVVKIAPATHTVAVLIGRDVLKKGTLLFDGENETFSLWF